jgi:ribosomal protein S4
MSQSKSIRIRPKLKFLVKYKVFSSIRIFKTDKLVKQKRSSKQASIKQRLMQHSAQRRRGWKLFRPRIVRNDIVVLPKSPVSLSKRYKNLLTAKQRFKLSVFLKNSLLKSLFRSRKNWQALNHIWLRVDFLIFKLFPVPSLFFVRQLIKHRFVQVGSIPVTCGSYLVKPGDLVVVTKRLFFPQDCLNQDRFSLPTPLFFDVDINYRTQAFVLNSLFLHSYGRFSNFSGFAFQYENIKSFYNR